MIPKPNLLKSYTSPKRPNRHFLAGGLLIVLALIGLTGFFTLKANPTNQELISPLSYQDKPQVVRQSLQNEAEPLAYYLAASQEYLSRAKQLANQKGSNQSASDKKKIIDLLNESLKSANNAVSHYPQNPEGYRQRALLFNTISHLDSSAAAKASRDLQIATALSGNNASSPVPINPQDLIGAEPIEEATLLNTVAIALPEDEKSLPDTADEKETNALRGNAVIIAGKTELKISSDAIKSDALVYFTPETDLGDAILTLKTKDANTKTFTLTLSKPLAYDISVDWWILEN